jgi:putative heme degradation protein
VVPRIIARASRVRGLVRATLRQMERPGQTQTFTPDRAAVEIAEGVYGGAYGRALEGAPSTTSSGARLDPTYSAKAYVVAETSARDADTLFWHTFDSRWMKA